MDQAGNLYVADTGNNTIRKIVLASSLVSTVAGTAGAAGATNGVGSDARFHNPNGLAVDGSGNLYVADTGNQIIRRVVVATGVVTTFAGTAGMSGSFDAVGAAARFATPIDLTVIGGELFVIDNGSGALRQVVLATASVSTVVGAIAGLALPREWRATGRVTFTSRTQTTP